jgi:hypothetical protein
VIYQLASDAVNNISATVRFNYDTDYILYLCVPWFMSSFLLQHFWKGIISSWNMARPYVECVGPAGVSHTYKVLLYSYLALYFSYKHWPVVRYQWSKASKPRQVSDSDFSLPILCDPATCPLMMSHKWLWSWWFVTLLRFGDLSCS